MLGVALSVLFIALLFHRSIANSTDLGADLRAFSIGLVGIVVVASFGIPPFSANHIGALVCALFGVLLGGVDRKPGPPLPTAARPLRASGRNRNSALGARVPDEHTNGGSDGVRT